MMVSFKYDVGSQVEKFSCITQENGWQESKGVMNVVR